MKDRLLTIAGGLLAFALVVILLVPVQRDDSRQVSRPLSADRGRAGLEGLKRWLQQGGVETAVLGRRYTALASNFNLSPRGNLLIVSLPQHTSANVAERESLRSWLAQGNSALVLVAAGDAPRWMLQSNAASTGDLLQALGFELAAQRVSGTEEIPGEDKDAEEGQSIWSARTDLEAWLIGKPVELVPRFRHPTTREVAVVSARSLPALDRGLNLTAISDGRGVLPLLGEAEDGAAFWEARIGKGRLLLSRYSDLFSNVGLGLSDNARFMANLVESNLGANGRVLFDDMHQGASDLYDAKAFFGDPRFANTMSFMVGFWLLYLIGRSRRLAPARETISRYYSADLARAMAGFFVRRLSASTVAHELFVHFFNDIRARYGLPTNGRPLWSMLSGMPQISADDIRNLQAHYHRVSAGKKVNLVASARLMQRTRKSLQ
jgi:hypothetical protein